MNWFYKAVYTLTEKARKYHATEEQIREMFEEQGGECAICTLPLSLDKGGRDTARIDHDHKSGKVRGILCNNCNVGLGMFKDTSKLLLNAAKYLKDRRKLS